jgi:MFS family permease
MIRQRKEPSAATAATVSLLALASAMGIGRFSLTPILPLMQQDLGLTLTVGSWLATANYVGYLVGAIICMSFAPRPEFAIRAGLVGVGAFALAMGLTEAPWLWITWRLLASVASALVLVGVSAWAMPILARKHREPWAGFVFSGVGAGIMLAGLVGLAFGIENVRSQTAWISLGLIAPAR